MTWEAAMRWAFLRARETGVKRRVYAYPYPAGVGVKAWGWAYAVEIVRPTR